MTQPATLTVLSIGSRVKVHGDGPIAKITAIKIEANHHVRYDVTWINGDNSLASYVLEEFEVEPVDDCPKMTLGFAGCRLVSPSPKVKK